MAAFSHDLLNEIRSRFAHIDACPFEGPRVFFENAGGSLTLNSVVDTSAKFAAIPDNQNRDNPASEALNAVIAKGKSGARLFFNAPDGDVFWGESGTEILFRLIRTATFAAKPAGRTLGTTLEHPASRSAMAHWAKRTDRPHDLVPHDNATGTVTAEAFRPYLTPDLRVVSLIHTSPVTGIAVDVGAIAAEIRKVAPDCFIIIDGIQHASHGAVDIPAYDIDGYAISPYKIFSRHGYGIGWASKRLSAAPKENLIGAASNAWELGTRDTGAYSTWSDVVDYLLWLGGQIADADTPRAKLENAARAIAEQERLLGSAMIHGVGNHTGLKDIPGLTIIGGTDNAAREGVISAYSKDVDTLELVQHLRKNCIRVHSRKNDHYSGNVLTPIGQEACVRISYSHYNSIEEATQLLDAMRTILV